MPTQELHINKNKLSRILLCMPSFTEQKVSEVHPYYGFQVLHSYLLLSNSSFYGFRAICSFVLLPVDFELFLIQGYLDKRQLKIFLYKSICEYLLSFLLSIYLEMELWDHREHISILDIFFSG